MHLVAKLLTAATVVKLAGSYGVVSQLPRFMSC